MLVGALLGIPLIMACGGGGEEERPRPVAHAATDNNSGTYWGGGASAVPTPPLSGSAGMRVRGGGGGALADAMRSRREDRRREMLEGLGPRRLTDDGSELWPVFEPAVRRMADTVALANEDDPCEETLLAGEVLAEEVTGSHRRTGARERRNCRGMDEVIARCANAEYLEAHHEECDPVTARGERARRAARSGRADVMERAVASGRASARRAGYGAGSSEDETPPPVVLPDLDIPSRGDGVTAN